MSTDVSPGSEHAALGGLWRRERSWCGKREVTWIGNQLYQAACKMLNTSCLLFTATFRGHLIQLFTEEKPEGNSLSGNKKCPIYVRRSAFMPY